jgi:hypothetical protein
MGNTQNPVPPHAAPHGIANPVLHQSDLCRERVYHEDSLLGTRSYNFLTAQAFLVAGLATIIAGTVPHNQQQLAFLIATLGLCIGMIHSIVTCRTLASIAFWRKKLREFEVALGVVPWIFFDDNLEQPKRGWFRSLLLWPFRIRTINQLLAWFVPLLLCSFWASVIVWIRVSIP